jgi:hypothetical protein
MSIAHKGSKLLLKDALVPVDFSSTHLDFNIDATGIQYGSLIQPSANAVYTMRPYEGKFGNAVALEQGTTNLSYLGGLISWANSGAFTNTPTFTPSFAYNVPNIGYVEVISGGNIGTTYGPATSGVSGNIYSISAYVWVDVDPNENGSFPYAREYPSNSSNGTLYYYDQSGNAISSWASVPQRQWIRLERNGITMLSGNNEARISFYLNNQGSKVFITAPQIEAKAFSTSFVSGNRGNSILHYNRGVFDSSEGSATFWFNTLANIPDTYTSFFTCGNYTSPVTSDWFALYHGSGWTSGNQVTLQIATASTAQATSVAIYPTFQAHKWYFICARWSKSQNILKLTMYLDNGTKIESSNTYGITPPPLYSYTDFNLGQLWNNSNGWINGLFSDFIIDRRYISDDEVIARFISNKPTYNPYDYRSVAY